MAVSGRSDTHVSHAARGNKARSLRIVGGSWRGRTWRFPEGEIRPTPDRVRETLFNWLQPFIAGARALDLFAGSGALGMEALSRGAARAMFIEHSSPAAQQLRATLTRFGGEPAQAAQVQAIDALSFLAGAPEAFNVVFLDPPFDSGLLAKVAERLETGRWLAPDALVYVECPAREPLPTLPAAWQLFKSGRAGEVGYHLYRRTP